MSAPQLAIGLALIGACLALFLAGCPRPTTILAPELVEPPFCQTVTDAGRE